MNYDVVRLILGGFMSSYGVLNLANFSRFSWKRVTLVELFVVALFLIVTWMIRRIEIIAFLDLKKKSICVNTK